MPCCSAGTGSNHVRLAQSRYLPSMSTSVDSSRRVQKHLYTISQSPVSPSAVQLWVWDDVVLHLHIPTSKKFCGRPTGNGAFDYVCT
jgi:hypothetical protein